MEATPSRFNPQIPAGSVRPWTIAQVCRPRPGRPSTLICGCCFVCSFRQRCLQSLAGLSPALSWGQAPLPAPLPTSRSP